MSEYFDFGQAVRLLKEGRKVAREGWNGKGMFLTLVQSYPVNGYLQASHPDSKAEDLEKVEVCPAKMDSGQMLSFIVMKTAGDSKYWGKGYSDFVPWLASQTDVLAEDWVELIVE